MAMEGPNSNLIVASLILLKEPATFAPMLSPEDRTSGLRRTPPEDIPTVGNANERLAVLRLAAPNNLEKLGKPILTREPE